MLHKTQELAPSCGSLSFSDRVVFIRDREVKVLPLNYSVPWTRLGNGIGNKAKTKKISEGEIQP